MGCRCKSLQMPKLKAREWLERCARGPDCMASINGMLGTSGDIANGKGFTDKEGNLLEEITPEDHKTVQRMIQHVHRKHEKYKGRHKAQHLGKPLQPGEFLQILTEDHDSRRPGALSHAFMGDSEKVYQEEEFVQKFTRPAEDGFVQTKGPKTNIAGAVGKEGTRHCAGNANNCNDGKNGLKDVWNKDKAQFDTLKLMCAAQGVLGLVDEIRGFSDARKEAKENKAKNQRKTKQRRNPNHKRTSKKQKGRKFAPKRRKGKRRNAKVLKKKPKTSKLKKAAGKVKEACDIDCGKSGTDFFVEVSRSVCRYMYY